MRLAIVTFGTDGDTRPLAALARAWRAAGHEAVLLADARSLDAVCALGMPAHPLSGDIRDLFARWGQEGARGTARAMTRLCNTHAAAWMRQAAAVARDCDGIVASGLSGFVGLSVAEHLGIPAVGAGMFPLTPSRASPSPLLPPSRVPAFLNHASMRFTNQLVWVSLRKALNRARHEVLGLPPRERLWTGHPMLYGISPTLLPTPSDWPANATLCGQWALPADRAYAARPDLQRFLDAGEPPVYVGFGSMTGVDMRMLLANVTTALAGRRAVFWPGWNGTDGMALPDNVHCIDATPHDWLFPRTAAVIHHGGSGTTHSALRAGKPSIVIPFAGDQPFWAACLQRLGVAPPALPARCLDAGRLADALAFVGRSSVVARARELGARMAAEDGLGVAISILQRILDEANVSPAGERE